MYLSLRLIFNLITKRSYYIYWYFIHLMLKPTAHTIQLISKSFSSNNDCAILTYQAMVDIMFYDGQFAQLQLPIWNTIIKRSYSIFSSYEHFQVTKQIQFMIKRVENGAWSNRLLNEHKIWDGLQLLCPLGHLYIKEEYGEYLLVGTGSWLAPLHSIYMWLGDKAKKQICYGERTSSDLIPQIIDNLGKENIILSREEHPDFSTGHVQNRLHALVWRIDNLNDVWVFLCGKPAMVDDVKNQLIALGIPAGNIKDEKY